MTKTFTQDDLIRFLYRETTEVETKEINKALLCDNELLAQYQELNAVSKQLNTIKLEPSQASIQNILNYAHGLQEQH